MKITLAKTAGFCFGVDRAVQMVYDLLDSGKKVCTLGPIIHNSQMVAELASRGVRIVDEPEQVSADEVLVIRSHGVGRDVYSRANAAGIEVADATCPFVSKIHKIVSENSEKGDVILVAGDAEHQEVKGITGHISGEYYVFSSPEELEELVQNHPEIAQKPVSAVTQTTFNAEKWKKSQNFLKKVYTNVKIFDTICSATADRQSEAKLLAAANDAMIVIGGRHSSNTGKLFEVCAALCEKTCAVETAAELKPEFFAGVSTVGVVAGASTPAGIIKEVIKTMSEILQPVDEQVTEETAVQKSFEEMTDEEAFEASLSSLTGDQKVVGTVVAVNPSEITVDIGRGVTGYITKDEYSSDANADLVSEVKVDDKLNLIIMKINDQEGTAMLSKRRYDAIAGWDKVVSAKESGEVLHGTVSDVVKGGVTVYCNNVRVFIPASQATASKNDSLDELKGKEVDFRIIEVERGRGRSRRAIGSIRSVLREARREAQDKIWNSIAVGDRFTGVVKSLTGYGAFVDIGGVDGMVHISELSWMRIKNPAEVVSVGDTIEVYVKALDAEKKKISLGYKKAEDNPWSIFQGKYSVNDVVTVTIVSMTAYGAFARIIPGVDGLIHISQISNKRIAKPQDELKIGQEVEAKITAIDLEKKRVSLSIRALLPEEETAEEAPAEVTEAPAEPEAVEAPAEPEIVETPAEPEVAQTPAEPEVVQAPAESEVAETPAESEAVEAPAEQEVAEEAPAEAQAEDAAE
ncbi:MAG: bifunctional 4-hydroxy-3-methylbut-2-enyl diphosphate reductase/30S ribosomal protein S1 [Clostridia bacterium]|nr:bifunctional 4-hydroxy-3-methylbut-2-enyl diphosphate reductase/30S ribosomal protein S1 [Clostridia bacterium]